MTIHQMPVGQLQTNCYILQTAQNNAIIIDAGASSNDIMEFIKKNNLTVKALFLTHGHYDHIGGVYEIKSQTGADVYIHQEDVEMLEDATKCLAIHFIEPDEFSPIKADVILHDNDEISIDEITFKVVHTPGHSKGSCVFLVDDIMFSGDTLFLQSIGRTDLYGGNINQMLASLKKLAQIEKDFAVLPGHGDQTTLSYEKRTNPNMGTNYDDIF